MAFVPINPNNYLAQDYADHKSAMYSLALTDPKKFYLARANVTKNLKRDIVKDFYTKMSSVLSTGFLPGGVSVYGGATVFSNTDVTDIYNVSYPHHLIQEECLSFSASIDKMMDAITEIIMPDVLKKITEEKLSTIGKATLPI